MKAFTMIGLFLVLFSLSGKSQDSLIILHPAVGDMIDRYEKQKYGLFPELKESRFEFARVQLQKGSYTLFSKMYPDSIITRPIDSLELHHLYTLIDTITPSETFETQSSDYPTSSVVVKKSGSENIQGTIMNDNKRDEIASEAIANDRIRDDSERQKMQQQVGTVNDNKMRIDFSYRKKKKRK